MSTNKQYGLILSKKSGSVVSKTNVFNQSDSDDSEEEGSTDWVKKSLQKSSENSLVKRETKIAMQKALDEDSTVYQYDEIYDEMELKKTESQKSKDKERKPKYIEKLLQTSEKRKRENERRIERQVQKDREAEGEQFKDKESFVTSAYKKKLEEFAKLDEEERRQDMLEEIGDVTKQEDISGFYRHLYQTTVSNKEDKKSTEKKEIKTDSDSNKASKSKLSDVKSKSIDHKLKSNDKPKPKISDETESKIKIDEKKDKECRNYRKRKQSESSDGKQDADTSSASSSSSSSESSSESEHDVQLKKEKNKSKSPPPKKSKGDSSKNKVETAEGKNSTKEESASAKSTKDEVKNDIDKDKLAKKTTLDVSIWQKRTVGPVFDAALKRYFERKAARELSKRKG